MACINGTFLVFTSIELGCVPTNENAYLQCLFHIFIVIFSLCTAGTRRQKSLESVKNPFANMHFLIVGTHPSFDTANVITMAVMFYRNESLTYLDLSHFDTSNVTDMNSMFHMTRILAHLDVSNFDTSNVTNMHRMFRETAVTSLDLSSFDTANVTNMSEMFRFARNITSLDLSSFDTGNVTNMTLMFYRTNSLVSLDISGFDASNVMEYDRMFIHANVLSRLILGEGFRFGETASLPAVSSRAPYVGVWRVAGERGNIGAGINAKSPYRFTSAELMAQFDGRGSMVGTWRWCDGLDDASVPDPDGPYFRVTSPFPEGEVLVTFIDIEYVARPTPGAVITEIYYRVNGGTPSYIYISDASSFSARGTFGSARVFIAPRGESSFVFYMRDTAGNVTTYEVVQERPLVFDGWTMSEWQDPEYWYWVDPWVAVFTNRIHVRAASGVGPAQMAEFAESIGGRIIGQFVMTASYNIGFDILRSYDELYALVEMLERRYPRLISSANVDYVSLGIPDIELYFEGRIFDAAGREFCLETRSMIPDHIFGVRVYVENGRRIFVEEGDMRAFKYFHGGIEDVREVPRYSFRATGDACTCNILGATRDPFWGMFYDGAVRPQYAGYPLDWAFNAMRVPSTWDNFGHAQMPINIGIVDSWFNPDHPDLLIPIESVQNSATPPDPDDTDRWNHGNGMISLVAAIHGNCDGLAGVLDIDRDRIFASAIDRGICWYSALRWNVLHGARVVNVSMGSPNNTFIANDEMYNLLNAGYDFIVIQSAGNAAVESTQENRIFWDDHIRDNLITVASAGRDGNIANFSNFGDLVDIAAPGVGIYQLNLLESQVSSGTSPAAALASGVTALTWSMNP